jgi:hypothetical protein
VLRGDFIDVAAGFPSEVRFQRSFVNSIDLVVLASWRLIHMT